MAWHLVTTKDKVSVDAPFAFSIADRKMAIFQVSDVYHALDDICPHAYALMSDGFVEGDTIECPLHGAIFHIPTGRCMAAPAESDLAVHSVRLDGADIYVDV